METIPVLGWAQIGPYGVITIIILCIVFGLLIPRWTFNRIVRELEKQNELLEAMLNKREEHLGIALNAGRLPVKVFEELKSETTASAAREGT